MKKGFTLIELLAVIIILAIVALIATPIVLDVVDDAKDSAAKSEAAMIVSGVNNYCAASAMKEQLNGTTDICKDGVSKEEISTMVDLGNANIEEVEYTNAKVSKLVVNSNGRKVTYNGLSYTIDEEQSADLTYAAYSVGDEVTLTDGTKWIVVKSSTVNESEIKLMAMSNIHPNLTNEKGQEMFLKDGYGLAYDKNNLNAWNASTLKTYIDGMVKSKLESSLNTTISDITIWGIEELTALGCTVTGNETSGYSAVSCDSTKTWYSKVFENTRSWTKLPAAGYSNVAWYVDDSSRFYTDYFNIDGYYGARPIITISKDAIVQKYYAFGLPTTSSSKNYQDVITKSGSDTFIKLESEQLSVCIYKNNTLECFENNNYDNEIEHAKKVFGAENCNFQTTHLNCENDDFILNVYTDGNLGCRAHMSGHSCGLNLNDEVYCN